MPIKNVKKKSPAGPNAAGPSTGKPELSTAVLKFFRVFLRNQYLSAIREGLTYSLPVVAAGTIAILINTFPLEAYQVFMAQTFGETWRDFGVYISNGTLGVISIVMALSISQSLAVNHNNLNPLQRISPAVALIVTLSCLVSTMEPGRLANGEPYYLMKWLGVHGLLWAIVTALVSSLLLRFFYSIRCLRVTFYSGTSDTAISQTMAALLPGILTILAFAAFKGGTKLLGIEDLNAYIYLLVYLPFDSMSGGMYEKASLYGLARHLLWFIGIHGSNVLEPIMTELYVPSIAINQAALAVGQAPTEIFTKPFFDCYTSMGGAGSSLALIVACLLRYRDNGSKKIAKISIVPAVFNINEILLFGLPVVLNPIFLIPFIIVPFVLTTISYLATSWGLVPMTINDVAWNTPVFINGYMATGSIKGTLLQVFNLAVAVAIYMPCVALDSRLKEEQFGQTFKKLIEVTQEGAEVVTGPRFVGSSDTVGNLARGLAQDLETALAKEEIYLLYQPQVNSDTGKTYGVEALMRWRHPQIGNIPPPVFIGIAEDTGYVHQLGLWSIEEAVRELTLWRQAGATDVITSVNVSAKQLEDPQFAEKVMAIVDRYKLPVANLKLEVTETIALGSKDSVAAALERINAHGIKLAIDDFGMGHTSLSYLKRFPIDSLKLDSILSRDVLVSRSSCEIIISIAELCRGLGVSLVAEFVEDEAHLLKLRELGCPNIQGYYYSRPVPGDKCLDFILTPAKAYGSFIHQG